MKRINDILFLFAEEAWYTLEEVKYLLGPLYEEFLLNKFLSVKQHSVCFSYVGIAANQKDVICILPKHLYGVIHEDKEYVQQARLLLDVLKTYEKNIQTVIEGVDFFHHSHTSNTNEIAVADYLLNDYIPYGIWMMDYQTVTLDGEGETLWDHTIAQTQPLIGSAPLYFETFQLRKEIDTDSVVSQIHRWAVAYSMRRYGLLLDIAIQLPPDYDIELESLGSEEYLLSVLERQLRITFADRDIRLLRALSELIRITHDHTDQEFSLYGHNSFEHVWENAVSFCLGNEYRQYERYLAKPIWKDGTISVEKPTVRPDVLRWLPGNIPTLLIIDAKYYLLQFDKERMALNNNPGVSDIVKQYFYEFILNRPETDAPWVKNSKAMILNILLFPLLDNPSAPFSFLGTVSLENQLGNNPILNLAVNPGLVFDHYRRQTQFSAELIVEMLGVFDY